MRVLIADEHPVFRAGLTAVLDREEGFQIAAEVDLMADALQVVATKAIDVAIVDILLSGCGGITLTRRLRGCAPALAILGMSCVDEPVRIAELLRAGANGFVHKTEPVDDVVGAIRTTMAGARYIWPKVHDRVISLLDGKSKHPLERLTARERDVFNMLVDGHSNASAATELRIAARTVETHRHRVLKKLEAHSIADLVRLAARWGTL